MIRYYLEKGYHIDIVSYGNALAHLQVELEGNKVDFFSLQDYPPLERGTGLAFYFMLISDILTTCYRIWREGHFLHQLEKKTDYRFVFSDGRYGFVSKKTRSYLLTHQLSFGIPRIFSFSQKIMDYFNQVMFSRFECIFIPDYAHCNANLAGKLSHPSRIRKINAKYIGILSSLAQTRPQPLKKSIDYLFTISGYLFSHKSSFVKRLLKEAQKLPGKKIFLLGDHTQKDYYHHDPEHTITIYGSLAGPAKNRLFHQAKTIISRAGYTTIMDLVELGTPAILFPTPNQTEQEYLASSLTEKGYFVCGEEQSPLEALLPRLKLVKSFSPATKTA